MTVNYKQEYEKWLAYEKLDEESRILLERIKKDENKIKEWFHAPLEFGTAGLRGIMRPGINSMNIYTVKHATQGIANLIKQEKLESRGVVIAYDSRNNSRKFAGEAAATLDANGIKVYVFDDICPTPELSFAIRYLGCAAGINITASHNPKEYNGYKVYWEDGAQLPPDHAETVSDAISRTDIFKDVLAGDCRDSVDRGKIKLIGKEIDEAYLKEVEACALRPDVIKQAGDDFKIIYTPLHGAGYKLIPEILEKRGVKQLLTVPQQMKINGDFPTVKFPNPEFKEVFKLGIEIAQKKDCSLIIGTDPDADRVGVVVRTDTGEFVTLSGNQTGALLLDYIIISRKETGRLKPNACAIKTIVTTELASRICEANGVHIIDVLTGFKFIGEKIKQWEETREYDYIFGFEESYGYLPGTYARDKDAVAASMLIVEMAAYYKTKNMTLYDAMQELYKKYGYSAETGQNIEFPGIDGIEKMQTLMTDLRADSPEKLGEYNVSYFKDYKTGEIKNMKTGEVTDTGLPKSDVLYFDLDNASKVIIRPSGTEPKIKIYYLINAPHGQSANTQISELKSAISSLIK